MKLISEHYTLVAIVLNVVSLVSKYKFSNERYAFTNSVSQMKLPCLDNMHDLNMLVFTLSRLCEVVEQLFVCDCRRV